MTFFADEGLDFPLVDLLRSKGHTVIYAVEEYAGAADEYLLTVAAQKKCIFLTKDKDFGELIIRKSGSTTGVVLIRIDKLNIPENCQLTANIIEQYAQQLPYSFTVIQEDRIRIRTL